MSDLILNNLMLILILMLMLMLMLATSTIWTTSMPSLRALSHSSCYRYLTPPLPADETTAAGKDFKWCTRGHAPDSQIKLQLRL